MSLHEGWDGVDASHAARVSLSPLDGRPGLRVDDRIERRQCEVRTDGHVTPAPTSTERFPAPVDAAVEVRTSGFEVVPRGASYVHGDSGVVALPTLDREAFGPGAYALEMTGPVKLYFEFVGPFEVSTGIDALEVTFDGPRDVAVGARSFHERPAATVTTTADPADLARAVSTFGSALKTTTSERSYPTLRGHPPAFEVGDELSIPADLTPPNPAVTLEVPPTLASVFRVASLAYYLGAAVETRPGVDPALVVDGRRHPLSDGGLERAVQRTLEHVFVFDCLVRTAGPRDDELYERRAFQRRLDADDALDVSLEDLHGRPAVERLQAYLEVPHEVLEPIAPTWRLAAHVQPSAATVEALPFLANDLAAIRVASRDGLVGSHASIPTGPDAGRSNAALDDRRRSPLERMAEAAGGARASDALEYTWVGDGVATGASKTMAEAYLNRMRRPVRDGDVEVVVVCNDGSMLDERRTASEVYGSRDLLPFDLTVYEDLTTERLRFVLESDVDYIHYIGHVDGEGFACPDGSLAVDALESVGVDVVFLNACRSYEVGVDLIRKGAVAGVVTLDDVPDSGATTIGQTVAELLDYGLSVHSALDVAKTRNIVGSQYLVVGYGAAEVSQCRGFVPILATVRTADDGYRLDISTFCTRDSGVGTKFRPAFEDADDYFLIPGRLPERRLSADELRAYLATAHFPVVFDGEFTWSDSLDL